VTTLLKPGILVSLKTTLEGGVRYKVQDLDAPAETPDPNDKRAVTRWETTKVVDDPAEHERAVKVRANAGATIRAVCSATAFGLLCPEARQGDLDAAVTAARAMVADFNASAACTTIHVYVLTGRIAESDTEAMRAIASELTTLLAEIEQGIKGADPKAIREACKRAQSLGAILDEQQGQLVADAVQAGRDAARAIVRRVQKDGEDSLAVIAELTAEQALTPIETARFAFLDLECEPSTERNPVMPAVDVQRFASLDDDGDMAMCAEAV